MNLFQNLFGGKRRLYEQLRVLYVPLLEAVLQDHALAVKTTERLLNEVRTSVSERTGPASPRNFGDKFLKSAEQDANLQQLLQEKLQEGVTLEDVRWWLNLEEEERFMLMKVDEFFKFGAFMKYREQGLSKEEAAAKVRSTFPIYGDPRDISVSSSDDRPLPFELKDRVNRFVERCSANGAAQMRDNATEFSSMNDYLRNC